MFGEFGDGALDDYCSPVQFSQALDAALESGALGGHRAPTVDVTLTLYSYHVSPGLAADFNAIISGFQVRGLGVETVEGERELFLLVN